MRKWIDIIAESTSWQGLYWFWYNPSTKQLVHVDGTHATVAAYEMGFMPDSPIPEEGIDMGDEEVISKALAAGWVSHADRSLQ